MNTPPRTPPSTLPPAVPMPATRPARRRRALTAGLGGASAATLLALSAVTAAPALAHDQLLTTAPEADTTVTTAPSDLTLTFSGNLISGQGIQNLVTVTDEAGHQWQDGDAGVTGPELTSALCEGMPNGEYDVAYRVVYSDGHSEAQQYSFTLDDPAAPQTGAPEDCGVPNPDAPVSSDGEDPTSAATASTPGSTNGAVTASGAATADAGAAASDSASTDATAESTPAGLSAWVWAVGIGGIVIVAAAMALVFRRVRAIDGRAGGHRDAED